MVGEGAAREKRSSGGASERVLRSASRASQQGGSRADGCVQEGVEEAMINTVDTPKSCRELVEEGGGVWEVWGEDRVRKWAWWGYLWQNKVGEKRALRGCDSGKLAKWLARAGGPAHGVGRTAGWQGEQERS